MSSKQAVRLKLCTMATKNLHWLHWMKRCKNNRLNDFLIGTDAPAGSGVQPNGMLRMVTLLASIGGLPAEQAWCCASGNVAKKRGLEQGMLEVGRPADIVFMDRPSGSEGTNVLDAIAVGNIPGIASVMIDGKLRTARSRSTPPSDRSPCSLRSILNG